MPRDRIGELERRLAELEATVRGLTEELVDAHARLQELEGDGVTDGGRATKPTTTDEKREANATAADADGSAAEGSDDADPADLDDIIVA